MARSCEARKRLSSSLRNTSGSGYEGFSLKIFRPKLDRPDRAAPQNSLDLLVWNKLSAENGFGLAVVGAADDKGLAVETGGGARGGGANNG